MGEGAGRTRIGEGVVKVALLPGMWGLRVVVVESGVKGVEMAIIGNVLCVEVMGWHKGCAKGSLLLLTVWPILCSIIDQKPSIFLLQDLLLDK